MFRVQGGNCGQGGQDGGGQGHAHHPGSEARWAWCSIVSWACSRGTSGVAMIALQGENLAFGELYHALAQGNEG